MEALSVSSRCKVESGDWINVSAISDWLGQLLFFSFSVYSINQSERSKNESNRWGLMTFVFIINTNTSKNLTTET